MCTGKEKLLLIISSLQKEKLWLAAKRTLKQVYVSKIKSGQQLSCYQSVHMVYQTACNHSNNNFTLNFGKVNLTKVSLIIELGLQLKMWIVS